MWKKYKNKIRNIYKYGMNINVVNSVLDKSVYVAHHADIIDSSIGAHSSVGRYDKIREADIGKYCSISWDCTIGAPSHPHKTAASCALTYRKEYGVVEEDKVFPQKRTIIGNDVWIGCDVTIISGVKIGNGAVIGAGAVCTKDIPPYEVWGGVPAKKIADRFDELISKQLNELAWWDWPLELQKKTLDLFREELTYDTIQKMQKIKLDYYSERV